MKADDLIDFEKKIVAHFAAGELPCLIHLSGGNEYILVDLFTKCIRPEDYVFSTHRNHTHALLKGIPAADLEAEILAGRSMFIFSPEHRFYTSAILAGCCGIAAGVAWDIAQEHREAVADYWREPARDLNRVQLTHLSRPFPWVWLFIGDGATENGSFAEAVQWAAWQRLPVTFIIEDNDRQVDTSKRERRGHYSDSWQHQTIWPSSHVRSYHYVPTYPHGGAGLPPGSVTFKPEAIERLRAAQAI